MAAQAVPLQPPAACHFNFVLGALTHPLCTKQGFMLHPAQAATMPLDDPNSCNPD